MSIESDEQLRSLKQKLSLYERKMEDARKIFFSGESKNLSKLMETINTAINKTKELIERRRKELNSLIRKQIETVHTKGSFVYGKYNNCWHVGKVINVIPRDEDISTYEYGVVFLGFGVIPKEGESLTAEMEKYYKILLPKDGNIKTYDHPTNYLRPGLPVKALFVKDGLFYDASIDSLDDIGYCWVKYKGYKGIFKLKTQFIRLVGKYGEELYGKENDEEEEEEEEEKVVELKDLDGDEKKSGESGIEKKKKGGVKRKRDRKRDREEKKRKRKKRMLKKEEEERKYMESKKKSWKSFLDSSKKKGLKGMKGVSVNAMKKRKAKKGVKVDLGGRRKRKSKRDVGSKNTTLAQNVVEEYTLMKNFGKKNSEIDSDESEDGVMFGSRRERMRDGKNFGRREYRDRERRRDHGRDHGRYERNERYERRDERYERRDERYERSSNRDYERERYNDDRRR